MSKLARAVVEVLRSGARTVYELSEITGRTPMSTKTIVFELVRSGYIVNTVHTYPARYGLTAKASEPIVIQWKKREPPKSTPNSMVMNTIRSQPNSVFALAQF